MADEDGLLRLGDDDAGLALQFRKKAGSKLQDNVMEDAHVGPRGGGVRGSGIIRGRYPDACVCIVYIRYGGMDVDVPAGSRYFVRRSWPRRTARR